VHRLCLRRHDSIVVGEQNVSLSKSDAPPADWIAGDDAQATRRLHIYRHAYRARLGSFQRRHTANLVKLALLIISSSIRISNGRCPPAWRDVDGISEAFHE